MMRKSFSRCVVRTALILALGLSSSVQAAPGATVGSSPVDHPAVVVERPNEEMVISSDQLSATQSPVRQQTLTFTEVAPPPGSMVLRGSDNTKYIEFGVRSDEVVAEAALTLDYTPSPMLIPIQSHVKTYLNDELMGVMAITQAELGKPNRIKIPLDSRYISDFNRIRLEFIGDYTSICSNPTHPGLWVDIGKGSTLAMNYQKLLLQNDLAHFPEPFYDGRDYRPLVLPMVFVGQPSLVQQQAAGILASWFGVKSGWRSKSFPVSFGELPQSNGILFVTNDQRPDFLRDHPAVNAPMVEMIDHPDSPYMKLLLVMGRNDNDLITAVKAIAQGNILFRGQNVTIDKVEKLADRVPYDAPNWVRTDRAMTFAELQQYPEQLQTSGVQPGPINIDFHLPPDLFMLRSTGIDMNIKYRYSAPISLDQSRLDISLNNQFIQAIPLKPIKQDDEALLNIPLVQETLEDTNRAINIPALKLGESNRLQFNFSFTSLIGSTRAGYCQTHILIDNHGIIDGSSTIDFSGYRHYLAMPDLHSFANSGFPFSRMADLSETLVFIDKNPRQSQVSVLLNTLGYIGSQVGYPAFGVQVANDWQQVKNQDVDLLIIGNIPPELRDDSKINLLVNATKSWVKEPQRPTLFLANTFVEARNAAVDGEVALSSEAPMGTIIGFQSPFEKQRSVVVLLASGDEGYQLINGALNDSGKRGAIYGSAVVIRDSGVNSQRVGDIYYVGHLPWWEFVWHRLASYPLLLVFLAVIAVVLITLLLWRVLRILSHRRLSPNEKD